MNAPISLSPVVFLQPAHQHDGLGRKTIRETAPARALGLWLLTEAPVHRMCLRVGSAHEGVRLGFGLSPEPDSDPTAGARALADQIWLACGWRLEVEPGLPSQPAHRLALGPHHSSAVLGMPDPILSRTRSVLHGLSSRGLAATVEFDLRWSSGSAALFEDVRRSIRLAYRRKSSPELINRLIGIWSQVAQLEASLSIGSPIPLPDLVRVRLIEALRRDLYCALQPQAAPSPHPANPDVLCGLLSLAGAGSASGDKRHIKRISA